MLAPYKDRFIINNSRIWQHIILNYLEVLYCLIVLIYDIAG